MAVFVFFQVPDWEKDANLTRYVFSQPVEDVLTPTSQRRRLS